MFRAELIQGKDAQSQTFSECNMETLLRTKVQVWLLLVVLDSMLCVWFMFQSSHFGENGSRSGYISLLPTILVHLVPTLSLLFAEICFKSMTLLL